MPDYAARGGGARLTPRHPHPARVTRADLPLFRGGGKK